MTFSVAASLPLSPALSHEGRGSLTPDVRPKSPLPTVGGGQGEGDGFTAEARHPLRPSPPLH